MQLAAFAVMVAKSQNKRRRRDEETKEKMVKYAFLVNTGLVNISDVMLWDAPFSIGETRKQISSAQNMSRCLLYTIS
jgi:hypothetical protein